MAESFSTINQKQRQSRRKMGLSLAFSLLLPPLGLILGLWLLFKGRKSNQRQLKIWGLVAVALAIIGAVGYGLYYQSRDNTGVIVAYPSQYSQEDLTVCLDGKHTIIITKDSPFRFDVGNSDAAGTVTLTAARLLLDKTNGDFVIGVGTDKGPHHFDRGECPSS